MREARRIRLAGASRVAFVLVLAATHAIGAEALTLTLAQAREIAMERHPRIAAARARAGAAAAGVRAVEADYFPQVAAALTAAGSRFGSSRIPVGAINNPSVYDRAGGGVTASQLLTDFGRTAALVASARLSSLAARFGVDVTRQQVVFDVDESYLAVLEAQAVLQVAEVTVHERQLQHDRIQAMAAQQLRSQLDAGFAAVALAQAQLAASQAGDDLAVARLDLNALLLLPPETTVTVVQQTTPPSPIDLAAALHQALLHNPVLQRLATEREAQERLAQAVADEARPTLSAVGAAGYVPVHDDRLTTGYYAGAVTLSVPLFEGGRIRAQRARAELEAEALAHDWEDAQRQLDTQVRVAVVALEHQRQVMALDQQLATQAHLAAELARARYRVGTAAIVELTQAEVAETDAALAAVRSGYDLRRAQAALELLEGYPEVTPAAAAPTR